MKENTGSAAQAETRKLAAIMFTDIEGGAEINEK
jgi:hypothetical protein